MRLEMLEGFRGAVAGAGQAVRTQADPCEQCHQRDVMIDLSVRQVEGSANQQRLHLFGDRWLLGRHFAIAKNGMDAGLLFWIGSRGFKIGHGRRTERGWPKASRSLDAK